MMKNAKKTLFSLAVTVIAVILAIQVSTIGVSPQITLDSYDPIATVVKAASKANDTVAVTMKKPVEVITTKFAPPSTITVLPVATIAKDNVQTINASDISTQPSEVLAQSLNNNSSAAAQETKPKTILPGIILDKEKNILYGPKDKGLVYCGFDYDLTQKFFYSSLNPWQRAFGYNALYDSLAPISSIYFRTRSMCFNYNGIDWMIKLWKGQYGITCGAEVGIYTKSPEKKLQYDCADKENFLLMDLAVYKGAKLYFTREAQMHWWQTGFVMGGVVILNDLTLKSTITFKDQEMTDAFVNALNTQGDAAGVKFVVNGISVSLTW